RPPRSAQPRWDFVRARVSAWWRGARRSSQPVRRGAQRDHDSSFATLRSELANVADTNQKPVAGPAHTECDRCLQSVVIAQVPCDAWRAVMALLTSGELDSGSQAPICFGSNDEVLGAYTAGRFARNRGDWSGHANAVPELDAFIGRQILFEDDVLGDVP